MAIQEVFIASVQCRDSAGRLSSASVRVGATDARAYIAAANQGARDATKVGLLLLALQDLTETDGNETYKKWSLQADFVNDAHVAPSSDQIYNSNKWRVTGQTTNAGIPTVDHVYIPQSKLTGITMESDGISADLTDEPAANFVVQFIDTAVSKYNTAFTDVISIQRNDT